MKYEKSYPLGERFISYAMSVDALRLGEFETKAGRQTPFFFDTGLFHRGDALKRLSEFYVERIFSTRLRFDVIFGSAYKGIPLAAATAMALSQDGAPFGYAFNRKEAKTHGEKGSIIGAPVMKSNVLILDDVLSSGLSVRESITLLKAEQAKPTGILVAFDRKEKALDEKGSELDETAADYIESQFDLAVHSIATIDDLLSYLKRCLTPAVAPHYERILAYRERYGVAGKTPQRA